LARSPFGFPRLLGVLRRGEFAPHNAVAALEVAAANGRLFAVVALLARGIRPNKRAVIVAAARGHVRCLRRLLAAGGDAKAAFVAACMAGRLATARTAMAAGANPRDPACGGAALAEAAFERGDLRIARFLGVAS